MREVVPALVKFIDEQIPRYDRILTKYGLQYQKTWDHESEVIYEFPCVTVGNGTVTKQWLASNYAMELRYSLEISGYIIFDDSDTNAKALRDFGTEFSESFEANGALTIPLYDPQGDLKPYSIYYYTEPPISSMEYDYSWIGDTFLRSFHATWTGYIQRQAVLTEPV